LQEQSDRAILVKKSVKDIYDIISDLPQSISIDALLNVLVKIAGKSSIRVWRSVEILPSGYYIGSWIPPIISISSLIVRVYNQNGIKMAEWKEQNEDDHRRIVKTAPLDEAFNNFRKELLGPLPVIEG